MYGASQTNRSERSFRAIRSAVCTRKGPSRRGNSDATLVADVLAAYAVADGDGEGAPAEAAAAGAVRAIERVISGWRCARDVGAVRAGMRTLETANAELWRLASAQSAYPRMAASAGVFLADGAHAVFVAIGSVSVIRWRKGALIHLDADSALRGHRLGLTPTIDVDPLVLDLRAGDRYLLASDGLDPLLSKPAEVREAMAQPEPDLAVEYLVAAAQRYGGSDDATALVVTVA